MAKKSCNIAHVWDYCFLSRTCNFLHWSLKGAEWTVVVWKREKKWMAGCLLLWIIPQAVMRRIDSIQREPWSQSGTKIAFFPPQHSGSILNLAAIICQTCTHQGPSKNDVTWFPNRSMTASIWKSWHCYIRIGIGIFQIILEFQIGIFHSY